ncbi:acylphosphatase [Candidatus Giovannonibacteria bacterium]|nr:acylphosphatase [Candidatus Giovannonibacteria bacterium]
MPEENLTLYDRMLVYGRVQMVLFRDSACRRARKMGLAGYVKNLPDGSVEIIAKGGHEKVLELFEWAKHGPIFARVERHLIEKISLPENFNDFSIKY